MSNLDARLREEMRFELHQMQARLGITSIFVTHDQLEAMTLSDHMIVMKQGRIEHQGSPRDVYNRPETQFVMDFLGQVNHIRGRLTREVGGNVVLVEDDGARFHVPVPEIHNAREGDDVLLAFRSEDAQIADASDVETWPGTVQSTIYMGSHNQYTLALGGSKVACARLTGQEPARRSVDSLKGAPRPRAGVPNGLNSAQTYHSQVLASSIEARA